MPWQPNVLGSIQVRSAAGTGRVSGTGSVGALDVFQGTGQVLFLEDADGAVAGVAYERDPSRSGVAVTAESLALGLIKLAYLVDLVDLVGVRGRRGGRCPW